ncbi:hypothetical protein AHF37_02718 [Paragonimus kellicotti]|nr:hypothetical protein AHF37_02718 [Paragonimus kellicotti]
MERRIPLPSDISLSFLNGTMYLLDPSFLGKGDRAIMCKSDENEAPINTFAGDFQESPVPVIKSGLSLDTTSQGNQHLVPLHRGLTPTLTQNWKAFYELTVTSDVQTEDKLVFTFDIEIVYGPIFTDLSCLSRLFYVMKGANFSTICPFDTKATSRCLVGVNQHEASNPADLRRVLADFSFQENTNKKEIQVSINSMQTGQDFELAMRLENPYGDSHIYSSLKVIPAASLAWIAAVVIGVIIVIVVIALSIWLYTRDRGETYKLYEKERAHGNDPIQEMKETEGFKTYQRQEEQPIASSRYSLNDESMHVGSEDDGELDEYEANFNEEGSFINGYTTDSAIPRRTFDQISPPGVYRRILDRFTSCRSEPYCCLASQRFLCD